MPRREVSHDPEIVRLAKQVGVVASAALAVMALSGTFWMWATASLRNAVLAEVQTRYTADSLLAMQGSETDARINRLADIVELAVVVIAEPSGSAERTQALVDLRRMRRVTLPRR